MRHYFSITINNTPMKKYYYAVLVSLIIGLCGGFVEKGYGQITSITIINLRTTSLCAGDTVSIKYSYICSTNSGQSTFYSQLSDNTGSFTTVATALGNYNHTNSNSGLTRIDVITIPLATSAGTYNVRVNGANGVTCTPCSGNISVTISTTAPTTPIAITGTTSQCPNLTSQIYSIAAVANATSYNWTVPTGWSITAGAGTTSITVTTGNAGQNGNITVNASNSCGTSSNRTQAVTVNSLPTINTQPTAPTATCSGSGTQTITVATNGTTFSWRQGGAAVSNGGVVSGQGTASLLLTGPTASDAGSYDVVIGNAAGCTITSSAVNVTVNAIPTATSGGPNNVCQSATPSAIALSGASVGGGATTGTWSITSGGGSLSSTAQTVSPATVTYTPAANYSGPVSLLLTTNAGTGCTAATATRTVNVNASSTAASGGPDNVCQSATPGAITLAGASIGGGATTGAWSITSGGGSLSSTAQSASPATVTYTPAANFSGTVSLLLTSNATAGCSAVTATRTINVNAIPTATAGGPNSVCQSATPSALTLSGASVGGSATTGAWSINSGGGSLSTTAQTGSYSSVTYTPAANYTGAVSLTLTSNAGSGCAAATSIRTINVDALPVINTQPTVQPSTCSGSGTQTFSVVATNAGTYSWRKGGVAVSNNAIITGQGTATLTITNALVADAGTYDVVITNGTCSVTSSGIVVTVNPTPSIPAQTASACSGNAFTISPVNGGATVVPSGTTYTWSNPIPGGGITGATNQAVPQSSISQTLINPTNSVQTASYTITPTAGTCTGSTFTGTVSVNPVPSVPTQTASVCSGTAFSFTPTNGGGIIIPTGTTYTWTSPTVTGGVTGGSAQSTGQASISQTLNNPTAANQTATYTITPTSGAAGTCVGSTFTAGVTSIPLPTITNNPLTQSVCSGGTSTAITITSGVVGANFTWLATPSAGVSGFTASGTTSIPAQTINSSQNTSGNVTYAITSIANTCTATANYVISVNPTPVLTIQSTSACSGSAFSVSPVNGGSIILPTSTTYSWTAPNVTGGITGGSALSAQSSISQTLSNPQNTVQSATYTVTPTSGATGACVGSTFTTVVQVNPIPVIPAQTSTICSGSTFTVSPASAGAVIVPSGTTYSWTNPSVTGAITGGSALSGQNSISQTLHNPTNTIQTATYTVTPTSGASGNCVGSTFTVTVFVNPTPAIPAQTTSVASGSAFSFAPSNGGSSIVPTGTTYTWTAPLVTGGVTGGSVQATGQTSISQTLTNPTNTAQTATYTVTPTSGTAGSCVGNTFTLTVTVNPTPTITNSPLSQTICSGSTSSAVTLTSGVAGATFSWVVSSNSSGISGFTASGSSTIPAQTINNSNNVAGSVTYSITATANSATSTAIYTINVNPTPSLAAQTATICSGSSFSVSPVNGGSIILPASTTYSWTAPNVTGGITGGSVQSGASSIGQTLSNPQNTVQSATYTVTPISGATGACVGSTFTTVVQVNPIPVIPAQTSAICSGSTFTVSPASAGAVIVPSGTTYSWTSPNVTGGITGGSALSGQNSISQTLINPTNATQTATYTVTPTSGAAGSCVGSTFTTTVTVNPVPSITPQTSTICSGNAFTVSPSNGGSIIVPTGTTYSWTNPTVLGGITGGGALSTQSSISQTLVNPTDIVRTATYTVTPTSGAAGSCVGSTFTTIVTVNPTPVIPAQTTTICTGAAFTVTPTNGGSTVVPAGTTYIWSAPTVTGGITGGSAQGTAQSSISQTLINPTNVAQTATYTVTPTSGAAGACLGSTFTIVVTVNPTPSIPAQTSTICSGATFSVTPTNGGTTVVPSGTTYTWTSPIVTGGVGVVTGGSAQGSGQTSISQTLSSSSNVSQTATYTITPNSGCAGSTFTVVVTINPKPSVPAQVSTICSGLAFNVAPVNGGITIVPAGTTYTWTTPNVTGGVTGGSAQTTGQSTISQSLTNPTNIPHNVTYTVTPNAGCAGNTFTLVVTVNPTPVIPAQTRTICSLTAFSVQPTNGSPTAATIVPVGTTYTWTTPIVTGGITGGSAQVSGQASVSQVLSNPSISAQTVTYTVTPTSGAAGSCVGSTYSLVVTVNPTPVIQAVPTTICSLTAFNVQPTNGSPTVATIVPSGTTYSWTSPNVTGGITGGTATFGAIQVSDLLNNPTNTAQTATYTVTPTSGAAGSCVGSTFVTTVTVNPTPVVPNQTSTICSLTSFTVNPINAQPSTIIPINTTYSWTIPNVTGGITGGTSTAGASQVSDLLNNPNNTSQTATYTVTPTSGAAGSCVGSTFVTTVTVNPTPVVPNQTSTICSLTSFSVNPINSQPTTIIPLNTTYTWPDATVTGGITGATTLSGQTSVHELLNNPTNSIQTATYTVTPTSGVAGSCVGSTFVTTVTINPTPVVPTQTSTICSLNAFTVSPPNSQPTTIIPLNTTYAWINPTVTGGILGGSAQTGLPQISDVLDNPTNLSQTATYTVVPTSGDAGSCIGAAFSLVVTVDATPVVPAQTSTICSLNAFTVSPPNSQPTTIIPPNTTYTWSAPSVTGGIIGGSAQVSQSQISEYLNNPTNLTQTATYTVTPTSGSAGSCVGSSFVTTVTVHPTPVVPTQTTTICSLTSFNILPLDAQPTTIIPSGTVYSWNIPSVTGGITGGSAQSSQSQISDFMDNPTNVTQTATYSVIPTSGAAGSCLGTTFTLLVTVDPTPVVPIQTATICSLNSFTILPINAQPTTIIPVSTTYSWSIPSVSGGIVGGTNDALQSQINDTLNNPTNTTQTATYTITPTSGASSGCVGAAFTAVITVNPTPVVPPQTSAICGDSIFIVNPINAQPSTIVPFGTTYTWSAPTGGVSGGTAQTGQNYVSDSLINLTNLNQSEIYTVYPTAGGAVGGCPGANFTINVTVHPTPKIIPNNDTSSQCSGVQFSISPIHGSPSSTTIVPAGTTYSWAIPTYAGAGGVTTNLINGNVGNAQSTFTQTLTNLTTTTTYWATYMVIPTAGASEGGCTGPVFTIVDTVFPNPAQPIVSNLTSIDSLVQVTICGGSTNISFNVDSVPNNTYQWTVTPTPLDSVLNPSSSNTVVTFGSSPTFDTARVSVTTTTPGLFGHCASTPATFKITVNPGDGIDEKTITPMEPGSLLWYQDNSVDGYKWGYDSKLDRKPHFIDGQVYQVFVPTERFLDTTAGSNPSLTYLDTTHYWYWVQVYKGSCESKIYYNGPYRPKQFVKYDFVPDVMSVDILPNPNNGTFEISIKGNIFGTVQIKLFNTLGQVIFQKNVEKVLGIENYSMELNDLNKGVYMLEIDGMFEERILSKVIITK